MYDSFGLSSELLPHQQHVMVDSSGLTAGPDCAEADTLRAQVAELQGTINAATARLVDVATRAIEIKAWTGFGFKSVEHWLKVHAGVSGSHAAVLARMAQRSARFPVTMAKFREGKLSEDQVRPIARHAPDGYDASIAEVAEHMTVPQLERVLRRYNFGDDKPPTARDLADDKQGNDKDLEAKAGEEAEEIEAEQKQDSRQFCSFGHDHADGMWFLKSRLTPEQGEIVQRALSLFRQDIFNERDGKATWHDALVRMAETALAAHGNTEDRRGADRYQVLLHMRAEALDQLTSTQPAPPSRYFHLGPAVSQNLAKYMSCDASARVILERDGRRASVGRKYRTVPDHTRTVVLDRDGGCCSTPGCGSILGLQIHHIRHWEDGGATDTANLTSQCGWCHRATHRGEITITGNPDLPNGLTFTDHKGRPLAPKPKPPARPAPTGNWTHPTGGTYDPDCIHFTRTAA